MVVVRHWDHEPGRTQCKHHIYNHIHAVNQPATGRAPPTATRSDRRCAHEPFGDSSSPAGQRSSVRTHEHTKKLQRHQLTWILVLKVFSFSTLAVTRSGMDCRKRCLGFCDRRVNITRRCDPARRDHPPEEFLAPQRQDVATGENLVRRVLVAVKATCGNRALKRS